ncbi:hypothetical protein C475_20338 [Halosimplex carlsbadense 2-9-1]|uniref:Uncharacterized protein n=1 Tax=Halosimplex carlsbadense 2-9-1 TaxID=797114 RepID=M0CFI7_9EURY|nr:hypothetical protein [Halosimplex carlsbadense]ELZ20649.1 hypothetical protein C475_20338 [Halosimplex carlsbadense 2-9-1]
MNATLAAAGLLLVGMGAAAIANPLRVRSFVSGRTWKRDPERAELYQRIWVYAFGGMVVLAGLVVVGWGLVA